MSTGNEEETNKRSATVIEDSESPFGNKKKKFTLVDSDDDADNASTASENRPSAYFVKIQPHGEDGINGFIMYMDGFADKKLGDLMFDTTKSKNISNFKEHIGCCQRVFFPHDDDGNLILNVNGHKYRAIAVLTKPGTPITDDMCLTWYNEDFLPAFQEMVELNNVLLASATSPLFTIGFP